MGRCLITIEVDTEHITQCTKNDYVTFSDEHGHSQPGDPESFTSSIQIGDEVVWIIKPKQRIPDEELDLVQIAYEEDTNILGNCLLLPNTDGKIVGTALHGTNGDEEEYGVYFSIKKGTADAVQYHIDPKLKIQSPH